MQMAFEPSRLMSSRHQDDLTRVKLKCLDGSLLEFQVFVVTFLGFGANEARKRFVQHLTLSKNQSQWEDPCLPKGLERIESDRSLKGTGQFFNCLELLTPLLNKGQPCPDSPCFFNGVHMPLANFTFHQFLGVSEFWYTFYDVYQLGGPYNSTRMLNYSQNYCQKSWKEIQALQASGSYPSVHDTSRLELQCFKSGWLLNILHEGFGFPKQTTLSPPRSLFESVNQIHEKSVSWTLGAMLIHISESINWPKLKNIQFYYWKWGILFFFFCGFLVCLFAFRRKKEYTELPIRS